MEAEWTRPDYPEGARLVLRMNRHEARALVTLLERARNEFAGMNGNEYILVKDVLDKVKPTLKG